jgi:outer membrane protein OmpA-like peptidoglycan-associated protein
MSNKRALSSRYIILFLILSFSAYNGAAQAKYIGPVNVESLPQTIGIEHKDRIKRLLKLSKEYGITTLQHDEMQIEPGQIAGEKYPIPVVRVVFSGETFFDKGSFLLRPDGQKVLDVITASLKHDVPDVKMLVLAHTDSSGVEAQDADLSKQRASAIMAGLFSRGIPAQTYAAVAIGGNLPMATNSTSEGRSQNRRVEFIFSANQQANLNLVSKRRVISNYFMLNNEGNASDQAAMFGLETTNGGQASPVDAGEIQLQKPEQLPDVILNKPLEYHLNPLNNEFRID